MSRWLIPPLTWVLKLFLLRKWTSGRYRRILSRKFLLTGHRYDIIKEMTFHLCEKDSEQSGTYSPSLMKELYDGFFGLWQNPFHHRFNPRRRRGIAHTGRENTANNTCSTPRGSARSPAWMRGAYDMEGPERRSSMVHYV
jgi:hypothetical protein